MTKTIMSKICILDVVRTMKNTNFYTVWWLLVAKIKCYLKQQREKMSGLVFVYGYVRMLMRCCMMLASLYYCKTFSVLLLACTYP